MRKRDGLKFINPFRLWSVLPRFEASRLPDLLMFGVALAIFYGIVQAARTWFGPFQPSVEISRDPIDLPLYAGYSLLRILAAYVLSLLFTLVYGYVAAYNTKAEK